MGVWFYINCIVIILACLSIVVYQRGKKEYEEFVKKVAKEKTFETINAWIESDEDAINSGSFSGHILNNIRDHKEMWEDIRDYKLKHFNDEDTVS